MSEQVSPDRWRNIRVGTNTGFFCSLNVTKDEEREFMASVFEHLNRISASADSERAREAGLREQDRAQQQNVKEEK